MNRSQPRLYELWSKVLRENNLQGAKLLSASRYNPGRRVYVHDGKVYKIALLGKPFEDRDRAQTMEGEFEILKSCKGISRVPEVIEYKKSEICELLVLFNVIPEHLHQIDGLSFLSEWYQLSRILFSMARRGICHNDITPENLLVLSDGSLRLVDFDQATRSTVPRAFLRAFFDMSADDRGLSNNMWYFIKTKIKDILPESAIRLIRKILHKDKMFRLPDLSPGASEAATRMFQAWKIAQSSDASAPGVSVAYYSLEFEGYSFPGERPWEQRWNSISNITRYEGKKILELGCNMSLLSCFLLREKKADAAVAVDRDKCILESAALVAQAMGVSPQFKQMDFDSELLWEDELEGADIVFALNVLNWVHDKDRFMRFLSRFDEVIFEGHDSYDVEEKRFLAVGFQIVELVGISERKRPLMYCKK